MEQSVQRSIREFDQLLWYVEVIENLLQKNSFWQFCAWSGISWPVAVAIDLATEPVVDFRRWQLNDGRVKNPDLAPIQWSWCLIGNSPSPHAGTCRTLAESHLEPYPFTPQPIGYVLWGVDLYEILDLVHRYWGYRPVLMGDYGLAQLLVTISLTLEAQWKHLGVSVVIFRVQATDYAVSWWVTTYCNFLPSKTWERILD